MMDKESLQAIQAMMQEMLVAEREHTKATMQEMLVAEREHTKGLLVAEREYTKQMIQAEVAPIKVALEELKEDMQEVKGSIASIVDWIDEAEHTVEIKFPVKRRTS